MFHGQLHCVEAHHVAAIPPALTPASATKPVILPRAYRWPYGPRPDGPAQGLVIWPSPGIARSNSGCAWAATSTRWAGMVRHEVQGCETDLLSRENPLCTLENSSNPVCTPEFCLIPYIPPSFHFDLLIPITLVDRELTIKCF